MSVLLFIAVVCVAVVLSSASAVNDWPIIGVFTQPSTHTEGEHCSLQGAGKHAALPLCLCLWSDVLYVCDNGLVTQHSCIFHADLTHFSLFLILFSSFKRHLWRRLLVSRCILREVLGSSRRACRAYQLPRIQGRARRPFRQLKWILLRRVSLWFKDLFLYNVGIKHIWCFSISFFNITSIAYKHLADNWYLLFL